VSDGPPRHLTPVHDEPPFDPEYDRGGRPPAADRAAERALLTTLLRFPEVGADVAHELDGTDFYWPVHEKIWDTWHHLAAADGTPPDYVIVSAALVAARATDAVHTVTDLMTDDAGHTAVPVRATTYARFIRDHARRRAFAAAFTRGLDLTEKAGGTGLTDTYLAEALQTLDDAINRHGGHPGATGIGTGLVDLSWVLTGGQAPRQPQPTYVRRTDGTSLFYKGQVNGVIGDPEHGKTWLAQLAVVEALHAGEKASMIDTDHNGPDASAARLLLLGARPDQLADPARFRYYEPQDGEQLINAVNEASARRDDVVLIDSLGEVFGLLGVNENHGDEVTSAMRRVCTVPAIAGACVITIDHLPKSTEARASGFAIGSIAKKRMIRGAYLRADAKAKPAPGQIGRITLRIEKDTMGELRRSSGGGYAGTLVLDSTRDYALEWSITRKEIPTNEDGSKRWTTTMERIARFIEDNPGVTQRDIKTEVGGKGTILGDSIQILLNEGFIRREPGPRNSFLHYSEIPYREAEDDHAQD
jgi:hypothetical protein